MFGLEAIGTPWGDAISGMKATGPVHLTAEHAGLGPGMMENASLKATGMAIAATLIMIICGIAGGTAIATTTAITTAETAAINRPVAIFWLRSTASAD